MGTRGIRPSVDGPPHTRALEHDTDLSQATKASATFHPWMESTVKVGTCSSPARSGKSNTASISCSGYVGAP
jgi:hypothetical protein